MAALGVVLVVRPLYTSTFSMASTATPSSSVFTMANPLLMQYPKCLTAMEVFGQDRICPDDDPMCNLNITLLFKCDAEVNTYINCRVVCSGVPALCADGIDQNETFCADWKQTTAPPSSSTNYALTTTRTSSTVSTATHTPTTPYTFHY